MAIDDKHDSYTKYSEQWKLSRSVYEGQDEIKDEGSTYLPVIGNMDDDQYEAYKDRGLFYNASYRTIEGMVGLSVKNEADISYPDSMEAFIENVDRKGSHIRDYVEETIREELTVGHGGSLIDYPPAPTNLTIAQAEELNLSPLWAYYKAENIFNWRFSMIDNVYLLSYLVLYETVQRQGATLFDSETVAQYRVLWIDENKVYNQALYELGEGEQGIPKQVGEDIQPKMNGKVMNFIPFMFHSQSEKTSVKRPPLVDLFNVNIKHYQLKADQYHGMHYVALPTPYATGVDPDDDSAPSEIGGQKLWLFPNEASKVGMLEVTGEGLKLFDVECKTLEQQMMALGARMLSPETGKQETATAAEIRTTGETSVLAGIIRNLNRQFTKMLEITAEWMNAPEEEIYYSMPVDFLPYRLTAQDVTSLVTSWQQGAFSKETLFDNLQRAEIVSSAIEFEEEEEKILNDSSMLTPEPVTEPAEPEAEAEEEDEEYRGR